MEMGSEECSAHSGAPLEDAESDVELGVDVLTIQILGAEVLLQHHFTTQRADTALGVVEQAANAVLTSAHHNAPDRDTRPTDGK